MSKTYVILASILILIALGLVFLPDSQKEDHITPERLLKEILSQSRFVSTDLIAAKLIDEDPSILLIDVRPAESFKLYSIHGALNIPLSDILSADWKPYLNQTDRDVIFFSNGDLFADQAWVLCTRQGYQNLYVMKDGLNAWFTQIMKPEIPPASSPSEAFDLYTFRKAASMYFGGGATEPSNEETTLINVPVIQRKKKSTTAGGC